MEIFIDKNFVRNYWVSNGNKSIRDDFQNKFLKHSNLCTIITNYSSLAEIQANEDDMVLFELLFEGVPKMVYNANLSSYEKLLELTEKGGYRIFFDEFNSPVHSKLEENSGYRFISSKTFDEKWEQFMRINDFEKSVSLPPNSNDSDVFNAWPDLRITKEIPTNSILIIDKYILSNKSTNQFTYNLFPLIENLLPSNFHGTLYISILSEEILSNEKNKALDLRAKKVYQMLNSHFSRFKDMKIRFSIIHHNKQFYPEGNPDIHDRIIYTNYYHINSPSGFDLFHKGKRVSRNSQVIIKFNFYRFQMKDLPYNIKCIKSYLQKMKRIEAVSDIFKSYPYEILGCPLLN